MKKFLIALPIAVAFAMAGTVSTAAAASTDPYVEQQVAAAFDAHPDAVRTSSNTVTWAQGTVELTVAAPFETNAVGTCATGNFCAYAGLNLTGTKLSYTACSTYSVTAITVRSIANARSSNNVQGRNSAGTTLTTVAPGGQVNSAPSGVVQLRCV